MRPLRTTLIVIGLALTAALTAYAASGPPTSSADLPDELRYRGALLSPTQVTDSSPNAQHGAVLSAHGGAVTSVTERRNLFLRFPATTCTVVPCPQAIVRPPDTSRFTPQGREFVFGADIRLAEDASPDAGMNVIQHGRAVKEASQWKAQLDYGHATCRWSDGTSTVLLPEDLRDPRFKLDVGTWYSMRCARLDSDTFEITVGKRGQPVTATQRAGVTLGPIEPTGEVTIGGKGIAPNRPDTNTDQFRGDLDEVFFTLL